MSALGQKQTYAVQYAMSALPPIATEKAGFGTPKSGHVRCTSECQLWAKSRHVQCDISKGMGDPLTLVHANKSRGGDDYDVRDRDRVIGRIMLHPQGPEGHAWFWTITARVPQSFVDRGYAATPEEALSNFEEQWFRQIIACHRVNDLPNPNVPSFMARCVLCNAQIWVDVTSSTEASPLCLRCADKRDRSR